MSVLVLLDIYCFLMAFRIAHLTNSILTLLLAVLTFGVAPSNAIAQYPPECPFIALKGPAGILREGELITYTLLVDLRGGTYEPTYEWSISAGKIISGQGTKKIEVRRQGDRLTTSVQISGLPAGCPSNASETANWTPAPQPVKVGVVRGLELKQDLESLDSFAEALNDNPNNQGYIFIGHPTSTSQQRMSKREQELADALTDKLRSYPNRSRITIVRHENAQDLAEFWRVPPGAENPTCSACETKDFPATDYFPIDEYGQVPFREEMGRLDLALANLKVNPSFHLLFVINTSKRESKSSENSRKNRIRKHVILTRKLPLAKVHFLERAWDRTSTAIYVLPANLVDVFKSAISR
jgi:hypothetical protein